MRKKGSNIDIQRILDINSSQSFRDENATENMLQGLRRCQMKEGPIYHPMSPKFKAVKKQFEEVRAKLDMTFDEAVVFTTTRQKSPAIKMQGFLQNVLLRELSPKKTGYDEEKENLLRVEHYKAIQSKLIDKKIERPGRSFKFFKELIKQKDIE